MKILITSGGTDVPIDDVRKISNMSSGKYGAEIATEFYKKYHDVIYFSSKNSVIPSARYLSNHKGFTNPLYKDYHDYLNKLTVENVDELKGYDIIVSAAAVSDYILDKTEGKISSDNDELVIRLKKAQKVLPLIRKAAPNALLVGFKLLVSPTEEEMHNAVKKVFANGADLVVYNDLTEIRKGDYTRYVFRPNMSFEIAKDAKELVQIILDYKNESGNTKNSNGMQA